VRAGDDPPADGAQHSAAGGAEPERGQEKVKGGSKFEAEVRKRMRAEKLSAQEAGKRVLDYRLADSTRNCGNCLHMVGAQFRGKPLGMQCETIGVLPVPEAWVDKKHVCNGWEWGPALKWGKGAT
jgi:hypothetical protein